LQRSKNALLTITFSGTVVTFGVLGSYVALPKISTPVVWCPALPGQRGAPDSAGPPFATMPLLNKQTEAKA